MTPLEELRRLVHVHCHGAEARTPFHGVEIRMGTGATPPLPVVYPTMVCFVVQGCKRVTAGARTLVYCGESYMLVSADLPVTGQVIEASDQAPYLALSLTLDPAAVAALVIDMPAGQVGGTHRGLEIGGLTPDLLDPVLRLARLFDRPQDVPVLAPLVQRELLYRLLQGPQGHLLRSLAIAESTVSQVRKAIAWIRRDITRSLRIEALAAHAGMSPSALHRHFKTVTGATPLQYQKQIRLHEARRRLVATPGDVAGVAMAVGYESASQFTREYSRQFGEPPRRDAQRLRAASTARAGPRRGTGSVTMGG